MMMTMHKFRDGIEREARQHENGGGWVASTATVMSDVFVGPNAEIIGGVFRGGVFEGGTFLGGTFLGGQFWGGTFLGGQFWGGTFHGGEFWHGTFHGGQFWGGVFRGGVFRGGTVTVSPTFLTGCFAYSVTITDTHAGVGCEWHKHDKWLSDGAEIAKRRGQTKADYKLLLAMIKRHQDFVKRGGK